jgi:hypothetical protein
MSTANVSRLFVNPQVNRPVALIGIAAALRMLKEGNTDKAILALEIALDGLMASPEYAEAVLADCEKAAD